MFNGKELNTDFGLDWSDYGARYYDAAIGRFTTIDPHAENYYSTSSYAYVANNPLIFIDPDGKDIVNAYQDYAQFEGLEKNLKDNLTQAKESGSKKDIRAARKSLRKNGGKINGYKKFKKVDGLISEFKSANETEFNKLDNLSFNGQEIDVNVSLSYSKSEANTGTGLTPDAETSYSYEEYDFVTTFGSNENSILPTSLKDNAISITLFKGGHNLGDLANEFGDAIFAVGNPKTAYQERKDGTNYFQRAASRFSFDYENYIIGKRIDLPNPKDY